jgi:hypothetical protein
MLDESDAALIVVGDDRAGQEADDEGGKGTSEGMKRAIDQA